jgi:hypothetical protein
VPLSFGDSPNQPPVLTTQRSVHMAAAGQKTLPLVACLQCVRLEGFLAAGMGRRPAEQRLTFAVHKDCNAQYRILDRLRPFRQEALAMSHFTRKFQARQALACCWWPFSSSMLWPTVLWPTAHNSVVTPGSNWLLIWHVVGHFTSPGTAHTSWDMGVRVCHW